ncbi:MAG: 30S ribosomal protein S20 [Tissierellia bacterium]|nr:30S ribosomal protein S20 [Tissierellia bacterium]
MANIKSAIKRIDLTKKQTARNRSEKSRIRTYIRKFNELLEEGKKDEAREVLKTVDKLLKRASHKNLYHKNNAARKLSHLQKKLNNA